MENRPAYLIHYGIKGQKKGRRRFQNEDGTLTAEGKDRYGIGDDKRAHGSVKKVGNNTDKLLKGRKKGESSTWKSKDASTLSDAELNRRNSRLQREQQYKNLTKSNKRKAAEWLGKTASAILVATAIGVIKGKATQAYKAKADSFIDSMKTASWMKIDLSRMR